MTTLTATEDGGFLFVLGFDDRYKEGGWASDSGFASHVVKCDKHGEVQFDTPFEGIEGRALRYCFEKNGLFFFFGSIETPETKKRGVYSPTDVYAAILDRSGQIVKSRCIAGSDYDDLKAAEPIEDGFAGSDSKGHGVNWVITLNDALEIVKKEIRSGRNSLDKRLGFLAGTAIYRSNPLLSGYDAGSLTAILDYGDYILIVSENKTGEYENTPPFVSAKWYYSETVYTAYDKNGRLLFRTSVDSSPDYDAMTGNSGASSGATFYAD